MALLFWKILKTTKDRINENCRFWNFFNPGWGCERKADLMSEAWGSGSEMSQRFFCVCGCTRILNVAHLTQRPAGFKKNVVVRL